MITANILKIFIPSVASFLLGLLLTRIMAPIMIRFKLWKRKSRTDNTVAMSSAFIDLHQSQVTTELGTPRVGGVIIWGSTILVIVTMFILSKTIGGTVFEKLDFLSRGQTLLPLGALVFGGLFGLFEDLLEIYTDVFTLFAQGLSARYLISFVTIIGLSAAFWFFSKLGMHAVYVPFFGYWDIGYWFIPFFVLVVLGTFSSRVIDGIDGLAAGVMAISFGTFGIIGLLQNQIDIATLCLVITGAILSFLWFNVPPAKYYMGETGMLGLTLCLSFIAFLTDAVFILPIVGMMLMLTSLSSFIQITSKKYFHKKVFKIAPLHHHLEANGWQRSSITMRYWIITLMLAVVSIMIVLLG